MKLTGTERQPVPYPGHRDFVAKNALLAQGSAGLQGQAVSVEQRIELIEACRIRSCTLEDEQICLGQVRWNGREADRRQQLRLEQLAHPGDFMQRQRAVRIRQKAVARVVAGVGVERLPSLDGGQLFEAQVPVQAAQARTTRREILIEQEPGAIDRAVVVQIDGFLKILQCFDGTVDRLLADGIVEPRCRVQRIELLGGFVLRAGFRLAPFVEIGLAEVAADDRILRTERGGDLDFATTLG